MLALKGVTMAVACVQSIARSVWPQRSGSPKRSSRRACSSAL